jgi:hypothetical protein
MAIERTRTENDEVTTGNQIGTEGLTTATIANADERQYTTGAGDAAGNRFDTRRGSNRENAWTTGTTARTAEGDENDQATPLFSMEETKDLRARWETVQGGFVDDPRRAVEQADGMVASAIKRLAEIFADERGRLEHQWDRGDGVSTEDLRVALRRYRSFFGRLLSV